MYITSSNVLSNFSVYKKNKFEISSQLLLKYFNNFSESNISEWKFIYFIFLISGHQ